MNHKYDYDMINIQMPGQIKDKDNPRRNKAERTDFN